jgi:hypothetical protein
VRAAVRWSGVRSWSGLLSGIGFVVFWSTATHRLGFLLGIVWELLWLVYGIVKRRPPFAVAGVVFAVVFARDYVVSPLGW